MDEPRQHHRLVVFAPQILVSPSRSGVQRVALEAIVALLASAPRDAVDRPLVELATWDNVSGQMRHYGQRELELLFAGREWPTGFSVHPMARKLETRFAETLAPGSVVSVLMPEVFHFLPGGNDVYARVISQCICYGWRTAAVFYDLIPIQNHSYVSGSLQHQRYIAELLRVDDVFSISQFSHDGLLQYLESLGVSEQMLFAAGQCYTAVVLPSETGSRIDIRHDLVQDKGRFRYIIVLGTVEPRKRQLDVVRAFTSLNLGLRSGLILRVIGSLHPAVADEFQAAIAVDPNVEYSGYVSDHGIAEAFKDAVFSIFASDDEGFGLPITESLAYGVPCLTANFGAMAEAAQGGGCLTVDVRNFAALSDAMERMALEMPLVLQLRDEIAARRSRTWPDYADDIWRVLLARHEIKRSRSNLLKRLQQSIKDRVQVFEIDPTQTRESLCSGVVVHILRGSENVYSPKTNCLNVGYAMGQSKRWRNLEPSSVGSLTNYDVLVFEYPCALLEFVAAAIRVNTPRMLPGWLRAASSPDKGADMLLSFTEEMMNSRRHRHDIAARETNMHTVSKRMAQVEGGVALTIVISTYNRAKFVVENVSWIIQQIEASDLNVELVVVDNASSDDTAEQLKQFTPRRGFTYIRNVNNVGMLGNLHVCSTLRKSRHIWLIGDDDFVFPSALVRILNIVSENPSLPFLLMNFGVYHRAEFTAGDKPIAFIAERQMLASHPRQTGICSVRDAGSQHDNLFTAVYPIVFRADILASVFNYPFKGVAFRSLVESIPTTFTILNNYADVEAMWYADCGIVGNAHNSWQQHRVAWHGMLMPLALNLARRAGFCPEILQRWAKVHVPLLQDAQVSFPDVTASSDFDEGEVFVAKTVLRNQSSSGD